MTIFQRPIVVVLCALLTALPAMSEPQNGNQPAGQITAMIPAATLNSKPAKAQEGLNWNRSNISCCFRLPVLLATFSQL